MTGTRAFPLPMAAAITVSGVMDKPHDADEERGAEEADDVLVSRAKTGDADAFSALVTRYRTRLYGLVYHMTSNNEDANDLVQEIFLKAYRSIKGFQGNSSFYTWLHTIGKNMTINFLKKRGKALADEPGRPGFQRPERQGISGADRQQRSRAGKPIFPNSSED